MELGRPGTACGDVHELFGRPRRRGLNQTGPPLHPRRHSEGGEQVARPFMRRGLVNICWQTGLALVHESARGFIKHSFCFRSLIHFNCAPTLGLGGMHEGDAGR